MGWRVALEECADHQLKLLKGPSTADAMVAGLTLTSGLTLSLQSLPQGRIKVGLALSLGPVPQGMPEAMLNSVTPAAQRSTAAAS